MKSKIHWLRIVICVLLIAALGAGIYFFFTQKAPQAPSSEEAMLPVSHEYDITISFTQRTTDPYDFYRVGETLYFQGGSVILGKITRLQSRDLISESLDTHAGKFVQVVDPDWKQIVMTVRATGVERKDSFTIAENALHVGKEFYPQTKATRSVMTVLDIQEVVE